MLSGLTSKNKRLLRQDNERAESADVACPERWAGAVAASNKADCV